MLGTFPAVAPLIKFDRTNATSDLLIKLDVISLPRKQVNHKFYSPRRALENTIRIDLFRAVPHNEVDGKARRAAKKTGIPTVGRLQTKRQN